MGFSGNIPNQYQSSASEAHGWAMQKFRQLVASATTENPPTVREPSLLHRMANITTAMVGTGLPSNVVVNRIDNNFVAQRLFEADEKMVFGIFNTCTDIETMCSTIYQLPETVPQCLALVARIKESLTEYRELSDRIVAEIRNYNRDILND